MKMNISVPIDLWNKAAMISKETSPSKIAQIALRFYVSENMTDEVKQQLINDYAATLEPKLPR